jgi:hypothetical protein
VRAHNPFDPLQLANDIKAGHFSAPPEQQQQMQALKKAGDRKGMLAVWCAHERSHHQHPSQVARTIPSYGQLAFKPASFSFPTQGLTGAIAVISGAIKFLFDDGKEAVFPVSRIRCWKVPGSLRPVSL